MVLMVVVVVMVVVWTCYLAELREVNVSITDNIVGQVDDLLLQGVQAQHLHGRVEILGVDGGLPKTRLVAPEDSGDDVQLLLCQVVLLLEHLRGNNLNQASVRVWKRNM